MAMVVALAVRHWQPMACADEIIVRISVKIILDADGNPPEGRWTTAAAWDDALTLGNDMNESFDRGFRYTYQFDGTVSGASQYWIINSDPGEGCQLEADARANPAQFHWRDDAMNAYVTYRSYGTEDDPICNGWASGPDGNCGGGFTPAIVVMCAQAPAGLGMVHEFGHFFGLKHTWGEDLVADTPVDANPNQCLPNDPNTPGHDERCDLGSDNECCCDTKWALTDDLAQQEGWPPEVAEIARHNLMSYHCDNTRLSEGQLDRFTDTARRYRVGACTGVTYFVDQSGGNLPTGYSDRPFRTVSQGVAAADPNGGDIVLIRAGAYNEQVTIDKPVTLRGNRGVVRIGAP